jgi:streptogramin lyase
MKTNTQLRVHPNVESLEERNLLSLNEFALPALGAAPLGITAGPDGALWFTERDAGQIGRLALDGSMTEFAVTTPGSRPGHITAGLIGDN